jgi:hypothetical protein
MIVVNVAGFPFKIEKNGFKTIIPYNGRPFEIPDFFATETFDGMLKVLRPPQPKVQPIVQPVVTPQPVKKEEPKIIEINLEEEIKETKEELKEIESTKPQLRGIKLDPEKRKQLKKTGKPIPQNNKENREKRKLEKQLKETTLSVPSGE